MLLLCQRPANILTQNLHRSPTYAFRSWLYIGINEIPAFLSSNLLGLTKVAGLRLTQIVLVLLATVADTAFVSAIRHRFGWRYAAGTAMALLLAAGPTHASSALLPSSFSMYCVAWSYAEWLRGRTGASIAAGAVAVLLGWPFCALLFVPMGLHMLLGLGGHSTLSVLGAGVASAAVLVGASVAVDWVMYGKPLVAVLNIFLYNALGVGGGGQGSDLYGVEPPEWYMLNGALNFGLWLPLMLAAPVALLAGAVREGVRGDRLVWAGLLVLPALGWLGFMSARAHKEERFLFPAYPLMAAAAGVSMAEGWALLECVMGGCRGSQAAGVGQDKKTDGTDSSKCNDSAGDGDGSRGTRGSSGQGLRQRVGKGKKGGGDDGAGEQSGPSGG